MSKAILEFNLPDEQSEFENAANGSKWKSLVWSLDQDIRDEIKYRDKVELQPIRDKLYELLEEYNLRLDD